MRHRPSCSFHWARQLSITKDLMTMNCKRKPAIPQHRLSCESPGLLGPLDWSRTTCRSKVHPLRVLVRAYRQVACCLVEASSPSWCVSRGDQVCVTLLPARSYMLYETTLMAYAHCWREAEAVTEVSRCIVVNNGSHSAGGTVRSAGGGWCLRLLGFFRLSIVIDPFPALVDWAVAFFYRAATTEPEKPAPL